MWRTALRVSSLCLRQPRSICRPVRLSLFPSPAEQPCGRREYSSQRPTSKDIAVVRLISPMKWLTTRFSLFLIQNFLDQDFREDKFYEGTRQAFVFVSKLLSQNKFDALENLVTKEILKDLQDKCSKLSDNSRQALAVESDEILTMFPGPVSIHRKDNGKIVVNITMCLWYFKQGDFHDDAIQGGKICYVIYGDDIKSKPNILTANYEFRREYTIGAEPDWIITNIEHSKLN